MNKERKSVFYFLKDRFKISVFTTFFKTILKKYKCSEDSDQIIVYLQAEMKVYFNSLRNFSDSDKVVFMINLTSIQQ